MTDKRTVLVDIAGARYRMTSDAPEGHLERLATLVNERIAALGPKAARSASPAQLLAIVALGLADDLVAEGKRAREVEDLTRRAVTNALERIDRRLVEDSSAEP